MKGASARATEAGPAALLDDPDAWRRAQDALIAEGASVPLEARGRWIREVERQPCGFLLHPVGSDAPRVALPVRLVSTRALPGHHRLRLTRFGSGIDPDDVAPILAELRRRIDAEPRLLGVNVEVFTPDPGLRERIESEARRQEYRRVVPQGRYRRTAILDLTASEEALFDGCSRSCRRAIREPEKRGFRISPLSDERWVPRMETLWQETFERTGAEPPEREWARRIRFARDHPDLYHIVAAFDPSYPAPDSLVAFACGMNNGDHAVYSDGASTREIDSRVPLSYAPVWRLIVWAREQGCGWFDMGGITPEADDDDPTAGISDFKRRFTRDVIEVGSEWSYQRAGLRGWLSERLRRWGRSVLEVVGAR